MDEKLFLKFFRQGADKGLSIEAAYVFALLAWNWSLLGGKVPRITSGRRSRAHQLSLRRRWEMGDRRGLVVQPALQSAHTSGDAFDVERGEHIAVWGRWIQSIGGRWGGTFSTPDPVHFDIRGIAFS